MSSKNQRQFLQLSIATLVLLQFLYFLPVLSNNLLSNLKVGSTPATRVHYELAITAVNDRQLSAPLVLSQNWRTLGVQEYDQLQLLIDNLARAMHANDIEKAQEIYAEIESKHLSEIDKFSFEIQHIQIKRSAGRSSGDSLGPNIINLWTSDELKKKNS